MNGEELPNMVEIWIEDFCYALTLWWEVRPVLEVGPAGLRGLKTAIAGEVGGKSHARAWWRMAVSLGSRPCRSLSMGCGGRLVGRGSLWSFAWVGRV